MTNTRRNLFLSLTALSVLACNNRQNSKPGSGELFYDLQLWAEEGSPDAKMTFQYRVGSVGIASPNAAPEGFALFDGKPMDRDSSKYGGVIYEAEGPLSTFAGKHTVRYVDKRGKEQAAEFNFQPFTLAEEMPERMKKEPFVIRLKNFPAEPTTVRLVMTDTAFGSRDVNDEMQIENGEVRITAGQLANLVAGPVTMEIYREDEKPLKQPKKDGRVLVMYSLRREFELFDE